MQHVASDGERSWERKSKANYKMVCPIAVPHADGRTHLHQLTAPIVEGDGAQLPGLLGLRTMEHEKAVLDMGNQELILPGPGGIKYDLSPGSVRIPLKKAPSGHLVMVVDDFENAVKESRGGLPNASLQFHAREASDPSRKDFDM